MKRAADDANASAAVGCFDDDLDQYFAAVDHYCLYYSAYFADSGSASDDDCDDDSAARYSARFAV